MNFLRTKNCLTCSVVNWYGLKLNFYFTGFLISFFFLLVFFGLAESASADTHYVRKTGSGSVCTQEVPCLTIAAGLNVMSAGDTLIVGDGTYFNDPITGIPSGSSGAYTTVRAENTNGVTIDMSTGGSWANAGISIYNTSYAIIDGFRVRGNASRTADTGGQEPVGVGGDSHHLKFFRIAAYDAPSSGNIAVFGIGDSEWATHDILIEDCWVWGTGRYKFIVYRSDKIIFRRCVARHDYHGGNDGWSHQEAGFANYDSSNTQLQNCIVIDSGVAGTESSETIYGAIWDEKHTGEDGHDITKAAKYVGNIILNLQNSIAAHLDRASGVRIFQNNIIWDTNNGGYVVYPDEDTIHRPNVSIINNTIGNTDYTAGNLSDVYDSGGFGISTSGGTGTWSITNSIIYNASVSAIRYPWTNTYMNLNNNTADYANGASAGTGVTTVNPKINGLLYLPRIETGSTLKTAGSGGGQIGAEVLYKHGTSGTLYGETGYDTLTTDSLWPFPNEDLIKSDFASYNGPGPAGARGFATGTSIDGSSQTLTKYIWEYLGNEIPCEIYDICEGDTTAPGAPAGLSVL